MHRGHDLLVALGVALLEFIEPLPQRSAASVVTRQLGNQGQAAYISVALERRLVHGWEPAAFHGTRRHYSRVGMEQASRLPTL